MTFERIYPKHKIDMKNNTYHVLGNGWKIKTKKAVEEMLEAGGIVVCKYKKTGCLCNIQKAVVE